MIHDLHDLSEINYPGIGLLMDHHPHFSYSPIERDIVKILMASFSSLPPEEILSALQERMSRPPSLMDFDSTILGLAAAGMIEANEFGKYSMTALGLTCFRTVSEDVSCDDFAPYTEIAEVLLPYSSDGYDAAHDLTHILRVWKNARFLQAQDGGDLRIILAAVLLHDAINVEKNSPARSMASRLSGELAVALLTNLLNWSLDDAEQVRHAIEAHSHSAGIAPRSLEAAIVQDADRLDALGMIGVTRCFYVSGRIGRALYDPVKMNGGEAPVDDMRFTLDHFDAKLFGLAATMNTRSARLLAEKRTERMRRFHEEFVSEVLGEDG